MSYNICFLGPDYKSSKGGISSVIKIYTSLYSSSLFIPTTGGDSIYNKLFYFVKAIILLPLYVLFKGVNIIHIHGASNISFYRKTIFIFLGKILGLRIIFHIHGGGFKEFYNNGNSKFIHYVLKKCHLIIVLSDQWLQFFKEDLGIKNVKVLNNVIDYPDVKKEKTTSDKIQFLFLGHIYREKGIFDLIEVINENKNFYTENIRLHIGGGMFQTEALKIYLKENKLMNVIKFHGWVTGNEKNELLNSSDVFILPSYKEGVPISILEAMSYGLGVISTNVGGVPSIVLDYKNGILIEPGNKKMIKKSIDFFIENPKKAREYGVYGRKVVEGYYPGNIKKELKRIYKEIL